MKTIIVAVVLVTGVVVAIWAQSPPIKWPEQVEKSQWPALYEGAIEQTATVCIDVAPKSSLAPPRASYLVRYLLTFKGAGHSIGLNPAPSAMRARLWDEDWFEDPVWRKDRVNAISAHFITAFLDVHVKGEADRADYLDVAVAESSMGAWPVAVPAPAYDAYSGGRGEVTLWKGFQRNHAAGLELLQAAVAH